MGELTGQPSVGKQHDAVGARCSPGIVGDHDDGLTEFIDRGAQDVQHLFTGARVEVAGGLVGDEHIGLGDECTGKSDSLLLPAGELVRPVAQTLAQPEQVDHAVEDATIGLPSRQLRGQQDVLLGTHRGHEVE